MAPKKQKTQAEPLRFSPSAMERNLICPGSAARAALLPRRGSTYAAEGSAAHLVAAEYLRSERGQCGWQPNAELLIDNEWTVHVTEEMLRCGREYSDEVRILRRRLGNDARLFVEHKFVVKTVDSRLKDKVRGTADAVIDVPFGTLAVVDYKFGAGVMVSPEWNPQLCTYALGALTASDGVPERVIIAICQPRSREGGTWRTWETTAEALLDWQKTVLEPGCVACLDPEARLVTGDHCRFCPVLPTCPQVIAQARDAVGLPAGAGVPETLTEVVLPSPEAMTNALLGRAYQFATLLSSWVASAKAELTRRVADGVEGTGYKLVEGRKTRKWKNEKRAADVLTAALGDEAFEKTLLSPAKLDKALGKKQAADLAGELIETTASVSLAPDADSRPALPAEAASAFLADSQNDGE